LDINPEWYRVYAGPVVVIGIEHEQYVQLFCESCDGDFRTVKNPNAIILIPNSMELRQFGDIFSCYGSDTSFLDSPDCFQAIVNLIKAAAIHLAKLATDAIEYDVMWACVEFNEESQ
jgi:hypothetical protein